MKIIYVQCMITSTNLCLGWVTVFAWQAVSTSLAYLMAGQLQGLVKLNNPEYVMQRWHTTLIMWAIVMLAYSQHMWTIKMLPMVEVFTGALHILMFFAIFVVMMVMGRNATAEFVFTGFVNETGWENDGVAWFIGLLPSIWAIAGTYVAQSDFASS
jgi:choline transport protein